jgi:hypothetical protein
MESNIEKLARLEKELAEVRESLENEERPNITYGQYYKKNGNYYVTIISGDTYILANLSYGTRWTLSSDGLEKYKSELAGHGFKFVGVYKDYLKEIGL